jgi:hypothetical protein
VVYFGLQETYYIRLSSITAYYSTHLLAYNDLSQNINQHTSRFFYPDSKYRAKLKAFLAHYTPRAFKNPKVTPRFGSLLYIKFCDYIVLNILGKIGFRTTWTLLYILFTTKRQ